jgi:hypothetical protein
MVRGDMGFQGVVVSDDLGDAAQVSPSPPADRALQFLTAGGDLVLTVDPAVLPAMYDGVLARARADAGFRVRVQQAALRVLELKAAHGLLPAVAPAGDAHSLIGGQVVLGGQRVTSPDGRYLLTLQTDGNVVDYAPGNRPLFSTGTFGQPGDALVMQTDGNLVVYAAAGQVLWSAGTFGHPGAVLREQNDGNAVVYAADGTALWSGGADHSSLFTGQRLVPGQQILSPDGRYRLLLQADGDVTVRSPDGRLLFRSGSLGSTVLVLQSDGNLVAYRPDGSAVWDSGTWRDGPSRLDVQNDGNVVLYRADGTPSWATGRDLGQNVTAPSHGTLIPHP